jgi:two-component system, NarL family, nitrate/nitrite response regulator NarL
LDQPSSIQLHTVGNVMPSSRDRIVVLTVNANNMGGGLLSNALKRCRNRFDIVTFVGSSDQISSQLGKHKPHVALISAELQDGAQAGFKVLQELHAICPTTASVMLLDSSRPGLVVEAFRKGARGVFCRTCSFEALPKCIQSVHQGQIWASNADLEHILSALTHIVPLPLRTVDGKPLLTRREEDVVSLVTDGMKNRQVAESLSVTEHTVRNYLSRIFDKVGISSRVELILYVMAQQHPGSARSATEVWQASGPQVPNASPESSIPPKSSRKLGASDKTVPRAASAVVGGKRMS